MAFMSTALNRSADVAHSGGGAAAHVFEERGRTVVCVHGEIDVGTLRTLEAVLGRAVEEGEDEILVDLAQVGFMDTAGLHLLLSARADLDRGGRTLTVRHPQRSVHRLLSLFAADDLIEA